MSITFGPGLSIGSGITFTVDGSAPVPTYSIAPDVTSVNEGGTVTFTVTTTNVADGTTLYWTNSGSSAAADFSDNADSGTVTVNSGTGTITRTLVEDLTTEGTQTIILQLRTVSTSGQVVATSASVEVADTSMTPAPTYSIAPDVTSVNEGGTVTFTVTTTNVDDGTTLYWTNSGTTTGPDFSGGANNGSFTINSNTATITRTVLSDSVGEDSETIILQVRTGSTSGTVVATSATVTVASSTGPTYSVTPNVTSVIEGGVVTFTVTTTGVANGTTLFWTNSGTTAAADFVGNANSGSFTINSNTGTISRTLVSDGATEGNETIILQIRTGSTSGPIVATSATVTVLDVSYSITPDVTSVTEGGTVVFTVSATGAPDGTTLFWTTTGTFQANDFAGGVTSGSVTINSGTGTISRDLAVQVLTEGDENFRLQLRTISTSGTIVATSAQVTITDALPTYVITTDSPTVNEGGTVTYTVTTNGVSNGTTLYWDIALDGIETADFTDGASSGTVVINSGTGTIARTLVSDFTTEGNQTIALRLRINSVSGTIVANAPIVTVVDSSQTPAISPDVSQVNEGGTVTFTVTETNAANGTTFFWENIGTTVGADFTDGANSGTVTLNNGTGTITRTLVNDLTTEGNELIILRLRTQSGGSILATSITVTKIDTSTTPAPTYGISPSVSSVNEGGTVTYTVTTTNVPNNTTLYWINNGTALAEDFSDNSNSGSVVISAGTGTITRTLVSDLTTEGSETIELVLRTDSVDGTSVAFASVVTVADTSTTPITYSITPNVTSVNEGGTVTFTVNTTNVANGTTLFWTNSGTTTAPDFTDATNSGSFTINSGTATITRTLYNDATTEGSETIILQVRTVSTAGTVVATSATVTVGDTSTGTDPQWNSVRFLFNADVLPPSNTDILSTTPNIIVPTGQTMTQGGDPLPTLSTSVFQTGTGSIEINGAGSGGCYIHGTNNLNFASGTAYTIEAWIRIPARPAAGVFFPIIATGSGANDTSARSLAINTAGRLVLRNRTGATSWGALFTSTGTPVVNANTWTHVAMTVSTGRIVRFWIGGAAAGASTALTTGNGVANWAATPGGDFSGWTFIGRSWDGPQSFGGFIDSVRVTLGERYTSAFTPLATTFPSA